MSIRKQVDATCKITNSDTCTHKCNTHKPFLQLSEESSSSCTPNTGQHGESFLRSPVYMVSRAGPALSRILWSLALQWVGLNAYVARPCILLFKKTNRRKTYSFWWANARYLVLAVGSCVAQDMVVWGPRPKTWHILPSSESLLQNCTSWPRSRRRKTVHSNSANSLWCLCTGPCAFCGSASTSTWFHQHIREKVKTHNNKHANAPDQLWKVD